MSPSTRARAFARRAATEHVGLKLVALVASVGLFVILRGTEDETRIVPARVIVPHQSERMIVSDVPERVLVTIRGSLSLINAVRRDGLDEIRIPADAEGSFFYIEHDQIELPTGISVVQIEPSAIELIWAERVEERFAVDPVIDGQVAEGFIRVGILVDPAHVTVRGAGPEVDRMDRVRTRPVDVRGFTAGRHEIRVPLMPLAGHLDYTGPDSVVVTVIVEEEEGRRTLEDVEVIVVGGTEVVLRPERVSIELRGPRARVDDLHPRRVIPFVDVSGFDSSRGAQPMEVSIRPLPDEIASSVDPQEILVLPR